MTPMVIIPKRWCRARSAPAQGYGQLVEESVVVTLIGSELLVGLWSFDGRGPPR